MKLTREYEAAMYRFVYNCFSMCIYALLFGAIIYIGDFGLTTDKHFALSLILGFFAGLLSDIGRKIEFFNRDMLEERRVDEYKEYRSNKEITQLEKQGKKGMIGNDREIPNSAWSEEDETKLKSACAFIRNTSLKENDGIIESTINWLKSLKERYTWKPSKREIQSVKDCALNKNIDADTRLVLDALYQDLLKLKG